MSSFFSLCSIGFLLSGFRLSADPKINDLQILGTHNSYKKFVDKRLMIIAQGFCGHDLLYQLDYEEPSLYEQAENFGVRNFEIDLLADPQGAYFSEHRLLSLLGFDGFADAEVLAPPGFKVMHDPNLDFRTICFTLKSCLKQLNDWSNAHPNHLPLFVQFELVEKVPDVLPDFTTLAIKLGLVLPQKITVSELSDLEVEIASVVSKDKIISPALVKQGAASLRDAVSANQWPYLTQARGKFIFIIDASTELRNLYLANHDVNERLLFTYFSAEEQDQSDAAFILLNFPQENNSAETIQQLVAKNFIVRTRTDSDMVEARDNDTRRRDLALQSGAQLLSTDYIRPQPKVTGTDYSVLIPDGNPGRCNPVRKVDSCEKNMISE